MVKIGDKVLLHPETFGESGEKGRPPAPMPGRIVYIHSEARFCTVAFEVGRDGLTIRESFKLIKGEIFK